MKRILLILLVFTGTLAYTQSANFRSQGKYYSAKEKYEQGSYSSALNYIYEAKKYLNGRTNYKLQYIHVMAAYKAGRYNEAQREMNRYFNILDNKEQPVAFRKIVERLTLDETKSMTKLIDKIDEAVERSKKKSIINKSNAELAAKLNKVKAAFNSIGSLETIRDRYLYDINQNYSYKQFDGGEIVVTIVKTVDKYKPTIPGGYYRSFDNRQLLSSEKSVYTIRLKGTENLKYSTGGWKYDNSVGWWAKYREGKYNKDMSSKEFVIYGFKDATITKEKKKYKEYPGDSYENKKYPNTATSSITLDVKGISDYKIKNLVNFLNSFSN